MSNTVARLVVIGRITRGAYVLGYVCEDTQTKQRSLFNKQVFENLVLNKQVINCTGQVYNGLVNLKGIGCKLNQLPRYTEDGTKVIVKDEQKSKVAPDLIIVGKLQKGKSVLYYVVSKVNNREQSVKLTRTKIMELARAGRIINAKCQMNGDSEVLRAANGFSLADLAVYQI